MLKAKTAQHCYRKMSLWFSRVLCFVQIDLNRTIISQFCYSVLDEDHRDDFVGNECLKLAIVKFFDVQESQNLQINCIDENVGCISIQWQRSSGKSSLLNSANVFSPVLIDTMTRFVHIVRFLC